MFDTLDFYSLKKIGTKNTINPHMHLNFRLTKKKNPQNNEHYDLQYNVFLMKMRQNEQKNHVKRSLAYGRMNVDVVHSISVYIFPLNGSKSHREREKRRYRVNYWVFMRMMHNTPLSHVIYHSF